MNKQYTKLYQVLTRPLILALIFVLANSVVFLYINEGTYFVIMIMILSPLIYFVARNVTNTISDTEKRYRIISENTNNAIWTMDLATMKLTFISAAQINITGHCPEEMIGMSINDILLPEYVKESMMMIEQETAKYMSGEAQKIQTTFEVQEYHKDGSLVWVEISACAVLMSTAIHRRYLVLQEI